MHLRISYLIIPKSLYTEMIIIIENPHPCFTSMVYGKTIWNLHAIHPAMARTRWVPACNASRVPRWRWRRRKRPSSGCQPWSRMAVYGAWGLDGVLHPPLIHWGSPLQAFLIHFCMGEPTITKHFYGIESDNMENVGSYGAWMEHDTKWWRKVQDVFSEIGLGRLGIGKTIFVKHDGIRSQCWKVGNHPRQCS